MQLNIRTRQPIGLLLISLLAAALLAGCGQTKEQTENVNPKLVDAVIQKLQDSGKLDDAVEESLHHLVEKRQEKQAEAQKKRLEQLQKNATAMAAPDISKEHVLGNPAATVSMIEYSDFECPFCKRFHETPQEVQKKFGDQVNLIYRSMPLSFHGEAAVVEARAGECAALVGNNKVFWEYGNDLFKYSESNGKGLGDNQSIYTLASKYKLDKSKFKACLDDPATQKVIDDNLKSASDLGISGTPTTIVRNNKTGATEVVVGARGADQLEAAINKVLGKSDNSNDSDS